MLGNLTCGLDWPSLSPPPLQCNAINGANELRCKPVNLGALYQILLPLHFYVAKPLKCAHCSTSMQAVNPNGLQIGWDRLGSGWNWGDKPGLGLLPTFTISVFERFLVGNLNLLRVFKKGVVFQSLIVNCWKLMDKSGDAEIWHPRHNSNPVGGPKGVEGVSHLDARRNRGQRLTIVCKSNSQAQNGFANICKLILSNFMLRPFVLASSISLLFIPANQRETVTCCDHNNYSLSRRNVIFKISQNSLHRL